MLTVDGPARGAVRLQHDLEHLPIAFVLVEPVVVVVEGPILHGDAALRVPLDPAIDGRRWPARCGAEQRLVVTAMGRVIRRCAALGAVPDIEEQILFRRQTQKVPQVQVGQDVHVEPEGRGPAQARFGEHDLRRLGKEVLVGMEVENRGVPLKQAGIITSVRAHLA